MRPRLRLRWRAGGPTRFQCSSSYPPVAHQLFTSSVMESTSSVMNRVVATDVTTRTNRVIEFFTAHIRNPHTRNAYALAAGRNTPSRKAKRPSSRPRKPATCSIPS